ncbi:beta-propeller fold lactonase family protein [Arthrobacter sp. LAPM80]|uniref:lactonase family protein n=1 Tax=Arthrobacter sp. LAPM80 TaxID=3141788 RepID=UPI00398AA6E3
MPSTPDLFVSGYTEEGYGAGPGLAGFRLLPDGTVGEQVGASAAVRNPSFVIAAGGVLLAVEELPQGNLLALDRQDLNILGRLSTGGADPCHVAFADGTVWAANYSSGSAAVLSLADLLANTVSEPKLVAHPGSGPVPGRQGQSHAHQVTATPWGTALVADLGADRVDEYALAGGNELLGSAQLPPGTGPRHVALKGDFLLVAGELDGCVHVLRRTVHGGDHYWHWLFKTVLAENTEARDEEFYPSHIELSGDGSKLYAAVRGPNTLVVLDVAGLPASADTDQTPTPPVFLRQVASGGNWPRHFALGSHGGGSGKLYVANQLSNNVAVFDLDADGLPGAFPVQSLDFGSPTCILLHR